MRASPQVVPSCSKHGGASSIKPRNPDAAILFTMLAEKNQKYCSPRGVSESWEQIRRFRDEAKAEDCEKHGNTVIHRQ